MSQPPSPYGAPPPMPPPPEKHNTRNFWLGALLALPIAVGILFLLGIVIGGLGALDAPGALMSVAGLALAALLFGILVFLLVREGSRWFAVGVIAGTAVLAIVAAGACVALISAYSG